MKINLDVPEYNPNTGVKYHRETGFDIEVKYENDVIVLRANKARLFSLANLFKFSTREYTFRLSFAF